MKKQSSLLENIESQAAFACVELGMARAEFDQLTPADFAEHLKWWRRKIYRESYNIALLRHTVSFAAGVKTTSGEPIPFSHFEPKNPDKKRIRKRVYRQTTAQAHAAFLSGIAPSRIVDARKANG